MAYSSRDDRSRRQRRGSSSRSSQRSNRRRPSGSRDSRPGANNGSGSRKGTLTRPDTGYSLRSRRVRPDARNGRGGLAATLMQPHVLVLILIIIIVAIVLVVGINSCVRNNSKASTQTTEEVKPKNEQDDRVAAGVSASMTSKFTEALDEGELIAQIAEHANEYDDDRLLLLALSEPSAAPFVAAYPSSDKASRPYDDTVTKGEIPKLFNWDERWGAVTYGDGCLAVTGSGPTTLAMAYMGLTGKTDFSPTEIAQQASKSNYADGDSGSKGELFGKLGTSMGLIASEYTPSTDTLYSLGTTTVFAVELKADTLTDSAHWALVVNINEDGSVTVFDPTSTMVSSRPWDMNTITESSSVFYALSPSEETLASADENGSNSSSTGATDATDNSSSEE